MIPQQTDPLELAPSRAIRRMERRERARRLVVRRARRYRRLVAEACASESVHLTTIYRGSGA
jgi:hypothetical protein